MPENDVTRILQAFKTSGRKIAAVVTYTYTMAALADEAGMDFILVGDSASRVVLGIADHAAIQVEDMILLARGVVRACSRCKVMVDLPLAALQQGVEGAVRAAARIMESSQAHCIKVEGDPLETISAIRTIAESSIPVIGHFGMPAGDAGDNRTILLDHAAMLEDAGCCALLLSKINTDIAGEITCRADIPTIGIGSGPHCDGQILVLEDMLGLARRVQPYYVKPYAGLGDQAASALRQFADEVRQAIYPADAHSPPKPSARNYPK
jgi:3-methyl-2-oxobutanoate hydroxymethyltransferase